MNGYDRMIRVLVKRAGGEIHVPLQEVMDLSNDYRLEAKQQDDGSWVLKEIKR